MGTLQLRAHGGRLDVVIHLRESLNYALMHNQVPLISAADITNTSTEDSPPLDIELRLDPLGPNLELAAAPHTIRVPVLTAGEIYSPPPRDLIWPLSLSALLSLDSAAQTYLHVQESASTATPASTTITVLPADVWGAEGIRDSLAAFIRPHDPAITWLLDETSAALEHFTGSAEIAGYHSGPGRVRQIVRGIYHVLSSLQLGHISTAESFLAGGHRIGSPSNVLERGRATTLELVTIMAAAIERAGIHSVVAVSERHGLLGWLSEPHRLPAPVVHSPAAIATIADSLMFETVEVTGLCRGEQTMMFDDAADHALHWWSSYEREGLYLIDVHAAHRRISALPNIRWEGDTRVVEVVKSAPASSPQTTTPSPHPEESPDAPAAAEPPLRIQRWRRSLLDLSYRNPLLRLTPTSSAELHVPAGALNLLVELLTSGTRLTVDEHGDIDDLHKAQGARTAADVDSGVLTTVLEHEHRIFAVLSFTEFLRRLRSLQRRARTTAEETGANPLYIAVGLLTWEEVGPRGGRNGGGRAPLFLVPVALSGGRGRTPFRITLDETRETVANISLVEKIRSEQGLTLDVLLEPPMRDGRVNVDAALEQIRHTLLDERLENYAVQESAHLALAQFSTLDLWRDMGENWQHFTTRPHVRHLVEHPGEPYDDGVATPDLDTLAETTMRLPVPADGSQIQAVQWAAAGKSFILEGPPGTGKSQTITNLIAECVHRGKKVLFVAEKQAALDVVQRRLEDVGLGPFTLDVHGRNQSLSAVRDQIRQALEASAAKPVAWDAVQSRASSTAQQLADYPQRLHSPGPSGLSAWTAHQLSLELSAERDVYSRVFSVDRETARALGDLSAVYDAAAAADRALFDLGANPASHPWALARTSPDQWDPPEVTHAVAELLDAHHDVPESPARRLFSLALTSEQTATLLGWIRALTPGFTTSAFDLDVDHLAQRAQEIDDGFWPFGKHRRKDRLLDEISNHMSLRSAIDLDHLADHFRSLATLKQAWAELEAAFRASDHAEEAHRLAREVFNDGKLIQMPVGQIERFAAAWSHLLALLAADDSSVLRWSRGVTGDPKPTLSAAVAACADAWRADSNDDVLLSLSRWAALAEPAEALRSRGLETVTEAVLTEQIPAGDVEQVLRRALTDAVLDDRLHTTGLHRFDPTAHSRRIQQFAESSGRRRHMLRTQLPAELVEARRFAPGADVGAVAQLQQQIGRRRGGLRIRQLFERFGDLITEAAPCLLMSPDSVGRFLPAEAVDFDVVVFDEASQIRVPEAIGAMGRGRSVVIVGDTRQMPPTSTFVHAGNDDDHDDALVPADLDSILSEAHESGLPRLWLTWHYRSRDESLIAFSNRQYYQDRLSTFPAPPAPSDSDAVRLRVVEGEWEGGRGAARVNRMEAQEVVREVIELLTEDSGRSVGVVTFNVQQRDLLLDMLEASDERLIQEALACDEEPLFVKNLENVQGDERDVVIFTLAFSRDANGRVPLQWGSMTSAGGERRLNVAITRARETVRIICSFEPHELDLRNSTAQGLSDLKEYLLAARDGTRRLSHTGHSSTLAADLHAQEVHDHLARVGLEVVPRLGLSDFQVDFAVRWADQPWVAVLLDGPEWAQRSTVGDRDALPQSVLVGAMGWSAVERVWLPEWLRDAETVVERVRSTAESAAHPGPNDTDQADASSARPERTAPETPEPDSAEPDPIQVVERHVEKVPYTELSQVMVQVLRRAFRAPEDDILRSVARLYGHQRMGPKIQKRLDDVFQQAVAEGLIVTSGNGNYEPGPASLNGST